MSNRRAALLDTLQHLHPSLEDHPRQSFAPYNHAAAERAVAAKSHSMLSSDYIRPGRPSSICNCVARLAYKDPLALVV